MNKHIFLQGYGDSLATLNLKKHTYKIDYTRFALSELEGDESAYVLDTDYIDINLVPDWAPIYAVNRLNDDIQKVYTKLEAQDLAIELYGDLQDDSGLIVEGLSVYLINQIVDRFLQTATWQSLETVKEELLLDIYDCLENDENVYDWLCTKSNEKSEIR